MAKIVNINLLQLNCYLSPLFSECVKHCSGWCGSHLYLLDGNAPRRHPLLSVNSNITKSSRINLMPRVLQLHYPSQTLTHHSEERWFKTRASISNRVNRSKRRVIPSRGPMNKAPRFAIPWPANCIDRKLRIMTKRGAVKCVITLWIQLATWRHSFNTSSLETVQFFSIMPNRLIDKP